MYKDLSFMFPQQKDSYQKQDDGDLHIYNIKNESRKAIGFLIKALPYPIKYSEDLKEMPKIGDKMKKEICRILGIGLTSAATFYFKGIKTLGDLKKN